jgi:hypothetical protein
MTEASQVLNDEGRAAATVSDAAGVPASTQSRWLSLGPLLDLSRDLRSVLVVVQPRPDFREELYRHLLVEARRQQALRTLSLPVESSPVPQESWTLVHRIYSGHGPGGRRWIIGAAAVGSAASLVGLVAYVRSHRHAKTA